MATDDDDAKALAKVIHALEAKQTFATQSLLWDAVASSVWALQNEITRAAIPGRVKKYGIEIKTQAAKPQGRQGKEYDLVKLQQTVDDLERIRRFGGHSDLFKAVEDSVWGQEVGITAANLYTRYKKGMFTCKTKAARTFKEKPPEPARVLPPGPEPTIASLNAPDEGEVVAVVKKPVGPMISPEEEREEKYAGESEVNCGGAIRPVEVELPEDNETIRGLQLLINCFEDAGITVKTIKDILSWTGKSTGQNAAIRDGWVRLRIKLCMEGPRYRRLETRELLQTVSKLRARVETLEAQLEDARSKPEEDSEEN